MIQRTEIAFFGMTNTGKSLLMNAVTNQETSVVSKEEGTTTDPVKKTMELLPLGPVTFIDTPGLNDTTVLGKMRIKQTEKILSSAQIAVIVSDATKEFPQKEEAELLKKIQLKKIPYIIARNKCDLPNTKKIFHADFNDGNMIYVSALKKENIETLKEKIALICKKQNENPLVKDLVKKGDTVLLIIPIDKAAPKGRLILPQQLVLRDLLDAQAVPICTTVETLSDVLKNLKTPPALAITDSQVFKTVNEILPEEIPLTSFSILMARLKGTLKDSLEGAETLTKLSSGDRILISEGCTHHRQCGDIGTQKLPQWIKEFSKKEIDFDFTSGSSFPEELSKYRLVVHCGGCMLTENEMKSRTQRCKTKRVPLTNYGMAIALMNGILSKSLEPLKISMENKFLWIC